MISITTKKVLQGGLVLLASALLSAPASLLAASSSEANELASLIRNDSRQQRSVMNEDPILSSVAQARAQDLADRGYFAHVNPDGLGANELARRAGYELPSWYDGSLAGNNIESLGAGYTSPADAFDAWLGSSGHRAHILAEEDFYQEQTSYGVGYVRVSGSPYTHYWVFLSAPPEPGSDLEAQSATSSTLFSQATDLGDGWYWSDALGVFWRAAGDDWAWSQNLADWFHIEGSSYVVETTRFGNLTATGYRAAFTHEALGTVYSGNFGGWVWSSNVGWMTAHGDGWIYASDLGWLTTIGSGIWSLTTNGWI